MTNDPTLHRSIGLPILTFYGVGTMVGAGFYALLGKVAGEAGYGTPLAISISGAIALVNAFSFAELSARFPVSAGMSRYAFEGFRSDTLATIVGWMVILTGIVSASTLAVATIGFLDDLIEVPEHLSIALLVLSMGCVAAWGIGQSVVLVTVITCIEVGALIVVLVIGRESLGELPADWRSYVPGASAGAWIGILSGSFLAFYAFIGFEDMVSMAEEVKNVRRSLPSAILIAIIATTGLYVVVSIAATQMVSPELLAESKTPIARLVEGHGWYSTTGIGIVSLLAGLNGALVQIIMASRVAYGMSQASHAPRWFGVVHAKTQTPLYGTAAMTGVILVLAVFLPLTTLAKITSAVILAVFAIVNLALWRIKSDSTRAAHDGLTVPRWVPLVGFALCAAVLLFQFWYEAFS